MADIDTSNATPIRDNAEPKGYRDPITIWLLLVGALVVVMILVGGFVRLSRAGLSIVEWDVVTGVVPPIGAEAWEESFADYQQTPEYQLVNQGMTLGEYQWIFYLEWSHRLLGRIAGLIVVLPLIWFMIRGLLGWRESLRYWGIAALFGLQGAIGWIMVSSGLQDTPAVSDVRLTIHLLTALTLLGIVEWMALNRLEHDGAVAKIAAIPRSVRVLSWIVLATVVIQIAYGGLVAGLKAGYLSNTWPLMFGQWVPSGWLSVADTWWLSMIEPLGAHFIHRWFAFVVAAATLALAIIVMRQPRDRALDRSTAWLSLAVIAQIALGVTVVLLGVPKWFALAHQGLGVVVFCISLMIAHQTHTSATVVSTPSQSQVV
jgi:cytochrome c oxidase assembly protein subunit 15